MINPAWLAVALASGVLLGVFIFGGLWWTVRYGLASPNPGLWFGLSGLLRLALVFVTFYYMALAGLSSVALCLLGLLVARLAITRFIRSPHQGYPCG
jgi:F1F0 ATPase subunit 2